MEHRGETQLLPEPPPQAETEAEEDPIILVL